MKTILVALGFAAMFAVSGCVVYDDAPDHGHHQ